jgi:hypothetical protein
MSNTTTKTRIPKRLKPWEDLIYELRELIEEAKRHGSSEDDLYITVFEDAWIKKEDQYERYIHKEIPLLLRDILRFLRFQGIRIYHKKDDVPGPEYLIEMIRGHAQYVMETDIIYDDVGGEWDLMWIRITKNAKIAEGYLPYYHEV